MELTGYALIINVFPLIFKYSWKLIVPVGLNALYTFSPSRSFFEPVVLAGMAVAAVWACALFFSRRRRVVFTALVLCGMPVVPVLYIPALSTAAFAERYLYLPSAGAALLLACGMGRVFEAACAQSRPWRGRALAASAVVPALLAALVYGLGAAERSSVWKDDYTLWRDTVEKSPESKYARYNLALVYGDRGELDRAIENYRAALRLDPEYEDAHFNLAWSSEELGDLPGAVVHYREAIRLNPGGSADAHLNLGLIYAGRGMTAAAEAELREALRLRPDYAQARAALSDLLHRKGAGG